MATHVIIYISNKTTHKKQEVKKIMSKTINFTVSSKNFGSKTDIAIDMFNEMIKKIAMKDNVEIEIKCNEYILEMNAKSYDVVVQDTIPKRLIVDNVFDTNRMKSIAKDEYRLIRCLLVEEFEKIELDEKSEVDEHWEFVELGGI